MAPMKRLVGVLTLALVLSAGIAPASAAGTVITVTGHVRSESGKALAGITVSTDCGCGFEGPAPAFAVAKTRTDPAGRYSFRINRAFLANVTFTDPDDVYLTSNRFNPNLTKKGDVYVLNSKLPRAVEIAGTVTDDSGKPVENVEVRPYNAATGKRVLVPFVDTNAQGRYHLKVAAGDYKLSFIGDRRGYVDEWFSDAATKDSAHVVPATGKKISGTNATVTKKQKISGSLTVDGKKPLFSVSDRAVYELHDATGELVRDPIEGPREFTFDGLAPGHYSVVVRPSTAGSAFFTPISVPVTLAAGQSVTGLKLNVTSVPPAVGEKRATVMEVKVLTDSITDFSAFTVKKGARFSAKISVKSYGSVEGGTLTFLAHGKQIATRTVPASGVVTWSTRFSGVQLGTVHVRVIYSGTNTTVSAKKGTPFLKIVK